MLNTSELVELRRANPVSLDDARRLADELGLPARVLAARRDALEPGRNARPRRLVWALAAVALLAAAVVATPAWGLVRGVLPFWDQPKAPQSVQVQFFSLNAAPPGA